MGMYRHVCETYRQFLLDADGSDVAAAAELLDEADGSFLVHAPRLVRGGLLEHLPQPSFPQSLFLFQAIWSYNIHCV